MVSDNGASGEGGPNGSVNENKFFNGIPDDIDANLAMLDELGGPKTYNHYPNGWAMAFNTPFKMWKRYEFNGGTSDPCIISWPAGDRRRKGEIRDQYHHAIDIVPTILDVLGVEPPETIKGHVAEPLRRRQHALQLRRRDAAQRRARRSSTRCSARAASGTTAGRPSPPTPRISGWSNFDDDTWELYHTDVDRSELHDLAAEQPERLRELVNLWYAEAGANGAFPLDDRSALEILTHAAAAARRAARPLRLLSRTPPRCPRRRRSTSATARSRSARSSTSRPGRQGVLFAHGARFGGHALYVKDNRLHYVYNFVGMLEQKIVADRGPADRREPDPVGRRSRRTARTRPASPPGSCRCSTAT